MLLCRKIRLQGSEADAAALEFMQGKDRARYNWWVMRLRDGERWLGWVEAKASLQASRAHDPDLNFVYGKLVHEVYFRLDRAMTAFSRRVRDGVERPGFPGIRPRRVFFTLCYPTLCYPAMYVNVEGDRLTLPTGGGGKSGVAKRFPHTVARLTEPAPEEYREVAVSRDARGHYYASCVSEQPDIASRSGGVVAFDLGVKTLATGVNEHGRVYSIGGFRGQRWYTHQLDKIHSKRERRQKKSRGYIHLSQVYQRASARKRNKQQDCPHNASRLIATRLGESAVVMGDLSQRRMVMNAHQEKNRHRNRAVSNDWGLDAFAQMLEYKCLRCGKEAHRLDERYTSQECSHCGQRQTTPLWQRAYRRGTGGLVMDRDGHSAINIQQRFLVRLGPHTGSSVRCAAPQAQ
jgi:putative transposase